MYHPETVQGAIVRILEQLAGGGGGGQGGEGSGGGGEGGRGEGGGLGGSGGEGGEGDGDEGVHFHAASIHLKMPAHGSEYPRPKPKSGEQVSRPIH